MGGFLGSYVHQMDGKGRISLPAPFRRDAGSETFVLIQVHSDALSLYPDEAWAPVREKLRELVQRQPEARHYMLDLTANAVRVTPDGQGRILIPDRLREGAGLEGEALIVGALDKMEIWNPELFEERTADRADEFTDLVASIFA